MVGINWNIIWTFVNLLVLFLLLKKFLFGPVVLIMEERKQLIDEDLTKAKEDQTAAQLPLEESRKQKEENERQAEAQIQTQVRKRMERAEMESQRVIADAREQATTYLEQSRNQIEKEREAMLAAVKSEVTDLAVEAARKIAKAHPSEEENKVLFQQILSKAGEKQDE